MLWQAVSAMYFRMAGGWTSIMPREYQGWPAVNALMYRSYIPGFTDQLKAFLAHHGAATIIVADRERPLWDPLLAPLHLSPIENGGVEIYRFACADLAPWHDVTALEMERRMRSRAFRFADRSRRRNISPAAAISTQLTPRRAESLGLLPAHSTNEDGVRISNGLYLGTARRRPDWRRRGRLVRGVAPVIAKYRGDAARIYFPFPRELTGSPHGDTFMRQLVIAFSRDGLQRAAAKASP